MIHSDPVTFSPKVNRSVLISKDKIMKKKKNGKFDFLTCHEKKN